MVKRYGLTAKVIVFVLVISSNIFKFNCFAEGSNTALPDMVQSFMAENKLNQNNFSVAYYNTVTGETYTFNETKLFTPASIYKLPLNMYYYEQEAAGNISPDRKFAGHKLSHCHYLSLQYSDNTTSQAMRNALGTVKQYKTLMAKYGGMTDEELGNDFFATSKYNTKFILNTLKYLYERPDFFSEAIAYLKNAQPNQFFEYYIPNSECEIAQKYGWLNGIAHTAGIIYADTPYLLVVFTENVGYAEKLIGKTNRLFYDYTKESIASADPGALFFDVPADSWYRDYVDKAVSLGLINGEGNRKFNPGGNLKISEAIKLSCMVHSSVFNPDYTFIQGEPWYQVYCDYAVEHGIVMPDMFGDMTLSINRAELAYAVANSVGLSNLVPINTVEFIPDMAESDLYGAEVYALYRAGVLQGVDSSGAFNPSGRITRAEAAAIITRAALPDIRIKK
ncbi:MAG: hypothetical protein GXY01_04820 [Clostridiales bacterium]|nr:hypothetical protein [Clostridiales bacterium]